MNTASSATTSRSPSMPRKPSTRSAVNPAGPVTHASRPSGSSRRSSCAAPRRSAPTSPAASIGTKICTASPSSDCDGRRDARPDSVDLRETHPRGPGCSRARRSASSPSPVTTTTAGMVSPPRKSGSRSLTSVASALSRQVRDCSFVETSSTLPKYGPPMEPPTSQTRISSDRDADPQPSGGLDARRDRTEIAASSYR